MPALPDTCVDDRSGGGEILQPVVLRGPSRSGQSAELRVGVFLDPVHAAAESLRPSHPIAVGESHVCAVVEEPTALWRMVLGRQPGLLGHLDGYPDNPSMN